MATTITTEICEAGENVTGEGAPAGRPAGMEKGSVVETAVDTKALLRLMAWLSPAFPIGGFAWSGGLERAVTDGLVRKAADLHDWLVTTVRHGALWNDAVLFAEAWRQSQDEASLHALSALGLALAGSAERFAETLSLGKAFVTGASAWPHPVFARLPADLPFPIAVGAVSAAHAVPLTQALAAWLHASFSQAISAGIRLSVAGQAEGVAILAKLEPMIEDIAGQAATSTLDDLGGAAIQAEIATLRHETQHSRLFRS